MDDPSSDWQRELADDPEFRALSPEQRERLLAVMEKMLEGVSFDAPDLGSVPIIIDEKFVRERLEDLVQDEDLSRFIL